MQLCLVPVDVFQLQRRDFPGAQAIAGEQEQHRVVAFTERIAAIHGADNTLHVIPGDRPGNG